MIYFIESFIKVPNITSQYNIRNYILKIRINTRSVTMQL